jgi:DNA-binding MarR family transcriptional regulator
MSDDMGDYSDILCAFWFKGRKEFAEWTQAEIMARAKCTKYRAENAMRILKEKGIINFQFVQRDGPPIRICKLTQYGQTVAYQMIEQKIRA